MIRVLKWSQYKKRLLGLIKQPLFLVLTMVGNSIILIGSFLIYYFEKPIQPVPFTFIDSLLWSAGLITTVGYADHSPQSQVTKIVILGWMLLGTLFIWLYMGFLVTGLIAPELNLLEKEMREVEQDLSSLKNESKDVVR